MNVKEASEIIGIFKGTIYVPDESNPLATIRSASHLNLTELVTAQGFIDCHEKYKPLVEALDDLDYLAAKKALQYYYKEILGEK